MNINNKRKRRYKKQVYINYMSTLRTSYKVTGSQIKFEDITRYDNKE